MLSDETLRYWAACRAVRSLSNGPDRRAAWEAVRHLEMVGLYASTSRLFQGAVACLEEATRASNPAARKVAHLARRHLRAAGGVPAYVEHAGEGRGRGGADDAYYGKIQPALDRKSP
jgi:hypothetical protein